MYWLKAAGKVCHAEPHLVLGLQGSALAQQRVDDLQVTPLAGPVQGRPAVLFQWDGRHPGWGEGRPGEHTR